MSSLLCILYTSSTFTYNCVIGLANIFTNIRSIQGRIDLGNLQARFGSTDLHHSIPK